MIIRVALFISLLALFYNYCNEGNSSSKLRQPNDINMMEVPLELSPIYNYDSSPETSISIDSSIYYMSNNAKQLEIFPVIRNSFTQN